jgi:hypothetical protein
MCEEEDIMDITRYTFQTPYSSQFQIGKPETVTKQSGSELPKSTNEAVANAEAFKATQIKEVTPKVEGATATMDVYV